MAIRAFIAVDIEEPKVLSKLISIQEDLKATGVPMKLVEPENIHLTLRFLGNIHEALVDDIGRIMEEARIGKFKMKLVGLGAFPNPARPRVVWVGVTQGFEELKTIRDTIERGLRRLGFAPEREEFVPHITLARIKGGNTAPLAKLISLYSNYEFGEIEVTRIRLKQSILTPRGPIYRTLKEVALE